MDIFGVIFPVIFIVFIGFMLFSQIGRNMFRGFTMGKVIEDYGIIGTAFSGRQQYRFLKCIKDHETFYVLEVQSRGFGSYRLDMFPFNYETVQNLRSILK